MENFSIWHWTIVILLPIVYLVPAARILRRAGFSGWFCLLLLVPPINLELTSRVVYEQFDGDRFQAASIC
ncbi:hypothetical protein [Burkholderia stabilis]|uniref:hypothetical protein n=1 Tax=Burkholderia stabilis TaxID=95485 RepID=UPI00159294E5|nr:hypothetical protein [Burkholderia stabilis]